MDTTNQQEALRTPFPVGVIKKNPKGMEYIPVSEVVTRLNNVLGTNNWSRRTVQTLEHGMVSTETGDYPKWISMRVEVTLRFADGSEVVRDGWGGQSVEFLRSNQGPVDLGDSFKGASSDAFKKACQSAGVALDLARSEEAMAAEVAQREADEPKANQKTCEAIAEHVKALPAEERQAFVLWWNESTGGKRLIGDNSGHVTVREADQAMQHLGMGVPELQEAGAVPSGS